jgi:phenylalanyl-tRNA synthetase beta chain
MRISYNLLKNFVDFDLDKIDIINLLTSIGFESCIIKHEYNNLKNVITVKILNICKHKNSDRLLICNVTDNIKEYSVVCGAKNISIGKIVPFAKIGTELSKNIIIKSEIIRGIKSEGMLCSEYELGIGNESDNILIFDDNTKIGESLNNIINNKKKNFFDVEIMTNRGDCLSHLGISREICAKLKKKILLPNIKKYNNLQSFDFLKIESDLCLSYMGCIIRNIEIKKSPRWLSDALYDVGINSINNIVDITNYVMIELGQPLHAFDLDKINYKCISIRKATNDENIIAINGNKYNLNSNVLITSDYNNPIAISGIIGGKHSSIGNCTKNIFLESAVFDCDFIKKTSRNLNITTESSYRFERGVDIANSEYSFWRAVNLIIDIANGKIDSKYIYKNVYNKETKIFLKIGKISKILGYNIEIDESIKILRSLGINSEVKEDKIICSIPIWRKDLKIEEDLIEEIIRIKGYDSVPYIKKREYKFDDIANDFSFNSIVYDLKNKLKNFGFNEVINYSFLEIKQIEKFSLLHYYKILNPLSKENEILRPSLIVGLYKNVLLNIGQGFDSIALFEYGKIFNNKGEQKSFGFIMYGKIWDEWWKWSNYKFIPKYDFYFGAGIVKNILLSNEFKIVKNFENNYYDSSKSLSIVYNKKIVGNFGILKKINDSYSLNIKDDIFYCELDISTIEKEYYKKPVVFKKYSKFPIVKMDISILANKTIKVFDIEKIFKEKLRKNGILKKYSLFSIFYIDNNISYSFRLYYRSDNKTLTDDEVNNDIKILLDELYNKFNIVLR